MSIADEKVTKPKFNKKGLWWKIPVAIIGLIIMFNAAGNLWNKDSSEAGFPTCGSSPAREAVKNAIENGVNAKRLNLKLLDLNQIKEASFDKEKSERMCAAAVSLNSGSGNIRYRMWPGSKKGMLLVEVYDD